MKIPTIIQEQNSFAGLTNKWLSKKVHKICVAYENMEKFFPKEKIIITGNPIRQDIKDLEDKKNKAFENWNFDKNKKTLLVVGGSLGAKSINEAISENLATFIENDIQVLWQTGKNPYQKNEQENVLAQHKNIQKTTFIYQMDWAYSIADVVVSRAGALAVSEIALAQKPAIFIPYPFAAEDHQTANAKSFADNDAALLIEDKNAKNELKKAIFDLLFDEKKQELYIKNIAKFAKPNASKDIANIILEVVAKHKNK
jgi:UDP-N-acetylglucosamine--N-acetylmuramyl-(pentapeptide) pyrophosphoryl-undecaprenol N-acetylglucosamine transferase